MSEEKNEGQQTTNEAPTKEELAKLEQEISQRQTQTLDAVKKDVAESVKKELKSESELAELKKKNEDLAKSIEEQKKAEEERLRKLEETMLQKLKDIENMKQGVATNENPFKQDGEQDDQNNNAVGGLNLNDEKVISDIEEESRLKYIEEKGLPSDWGIRR